MPARVEASRPAARSRYRAPEHWQQVPSTEAGITNGLSLKLPYLYMAGDRSLLGRPAVAIVGSRKASALGLKRAEQLARVLVRHGIVVVSGLAEGIDQAAHRSAIANGGKTIAVIGTPLDHAYPAKHAELQELIHREHLLVTPFAHGARIYPSNFPDRNKVMARLSTATVIIEAGDTSGTLHQAAECELVRRPLFIAASVMNDPKLEWPKRFKTAHVLSDPAEMIAKLSA